MTMKRRTRSLFGALLPGKKSDQGGWVNLAAGALLGGAMGAFQKKPGEYKPYEMTTDQPFRQGYAQDVLGNLQDWQNGKPLMTQAQINEQLSGSIGRLVGASQAERTRIVERALDRQGRMGGMAEASLAALGRSQMGEQRQLEAGVHNALAAKAHEFRLSAAQTGLDYIGADQDRALAEYHAQQQALAARQQFSKWGNILGGAVAGASAFSGSGGGGGGGRGGQPGGGLTKIDGAYYRSNGSSYDPATGRPVFW